MLIVVTGPPAAGKSSWVRANAKPGDIVIDFDLIAQAVSAPGADAHDHPKAVKQTAYRARQAAVGEALRHIARVDVYVIHSLPTDEVRAKYAGHGAHVVTIDPGRDVVMARIAEQRPGGARAAARRWYARHGHDHRTDQPTSRPW